MLLLILSLILHVHTGESVNAALDSARAVYASHGERTTLLIEPGTYREQLTIDIPGIRLINAAKHPSIALYNHGVDADTNAVRLTWYYGHGYQYTSMGDSINYGGSRTRRWNASVLVTAPDFYAENIIFENSFNLYVCNPEAQDSLSPLPLSSSNSLTYPIRPKEVGSIEVQQKRFRERAAAISFTQTARHAHLLNCRAVGRQDVLYGDSGASIYWQGGILQGSVDFIFGAMQMAVNHATLIANINGEKDDKCYIAAGRSEEGHRGLLFCHCHIRLATDAELEIVNRQSFNRQLVWLSRPWRAWGETVWAYTTWDEGVVNSDGWHLGLLHKRPEYDATNPCPRSYEYRSQDKSEGRPQWVNILKRPTLPDGTRINIRNWKK